MRLYFLRHAQAEDGYGSDFDRLLTNRGVSRTKTAAQVIKNLGVMPNHIYTSPRIRAYQTAEIVAEALEIKVEVEEGLNFGFNLDVVQELTEDKRRDEEIMFVGHEPSMSMVLRLMTGSDLDMKKGGLARVDVGYIAQPLRGELIWLIAPKVFDALEL